MSLSHHDHAFSPLGDGQELPPHICLGRCDYCGARMYAGESPVVVPGTYDRVHLHCLTAYLEDNPIPLRKEEDL